MNWEAWLTLAIVVGILITLAWNVASTDVLLMGAATVLMTLSLASDRFPSPRQIAAGFGNEGLLTVAVLFVVAAGLTETGAMAMVTERVSGGSSLIDVLDRVLDKGIVIDAWVRLALVGIDLVTVEARVSVRAASAHFSSAMATVTKRSRSSSSAGSMSIAAS